MRLSQVLIRVRVYSELMVEYPREESANICSEWDNVDLYLSSCLKEGFNFGYGQGTIWISINCVFLFISLLRAVTINREMVSLIMAVAQHHFNISSISISSVYITVSSVPTNQSVTHHSLVRLYHSKHLLLGHSPVRLMQSVACLDCYTRSCIAYSRPSAILLERILESTPRRRTQLLVLRLAMNKLR